MLETSKASFHVITEENINQIPCLSSQTFEFNAHVRMPFIKGKLYLHQPWFFSTAECQRANLDWSGYERRRREFVFAA